MWRYGSLLMCATWSFNGLMAALSSDAGWLWWLDLFALIWLPFAVVDLVINIRDAHTGRISTGA